MAMWTPDHKAKRMSNWFLALVNNAVSKEANYLVVRNKEWQLPEPSSDNPASFFWTKRHLLWMKLTRNVSSRPLKTLCRIGLWWSSRTEWVPLKDATRSSFLSTAKWLRRATSTIWNNREVNSPNCLPTSRIEYWKSLHFESSTKIYLFTSYISRSWFT